MKKLLFLLSVIVLFGCEKEEAKEAKLDDRMVNTKWQAKDYMYENLFGGVCFSVYEFTSTTELDHYITRNGAVAHSMGSLTYAVDYPSLKLINKDGTISEFTFKDNRTLVRTIQEGSLYLYSDYIKQ